MDVSHLLLSEEDSDVRVIVEKKMARSNFPAHSFVLKQRSPVIAKMLESNFIEGQTKTILITDFKAIHIGMFLRYLYTDMLPETYTGLCKLVKIADKYLVSKLKEKCEESLLDFFNVQNVYELCELADSYSLEKLRERCLFLIKRAGFKLLTSGDLNCFSIETMSAIVSADDLNVTKEIDVFSAIWKWGNLKLRYDGMAFANENVLKLIAELLKHVRWSLTDEEDQAKMVSLGLKVNDANLKKEWQPRKPSDTSIDTPWYFRQCDVVLVEEYVNYFVLPKGSASESYSDLMHAVSMSDLPFYVVGVLFACTEETTLVKLVCMSGSESSVAEIPLQVGKAVSISASTTCTACLRSTLGIALNYQEIMFEFPNPVLVCKNQKLMIGIKSRRYPCHVQKQSDGEIIYSRNGRKLFIYGNVFGLKKVFVL